MAHYNAPVIHVDPVELQINELFDRMVNRLNQRRVALLTWYRDLSNEKAARRSDRVKKLQELVGMKAETERRLQMNELRELQEKILSDIEPKLAEVMAPQPETRVVFRSRSEPLEQLIAELGEVLEEEVLVVPNYQTMREVVAAVKEGTAPGELSVPKAVAIDYNTNNIFVAEGIAFLYLHARISIFSERGVYLDSITHQDMMQLHGIAIHEDNLYVTDTGVHAVFLFKTETSFPLVAKLGTRGSQIGEFDRPRNLAVSINGDVYVADCGNHRIQILNSSLQHIRNLTEQPIMRPHDIKLTADEVYVLCDDNPCILVLSHAGERLRSLVSRGYQEEVREPWFFCLDAAKNIIISDMLADKVKIFTKEGALIHTIEVRQYGMFLCQQQGLALTKDLNLVVVCSNGNYCLRIYSCL